MNWPVFVQALSESEKDILRALLAVPACTLNALTPSEAEIAEFHKPGCKIDAIKMFRMRTGVDLMTAKAIMDKY